jgi:predicted amidohydrolase YtcJ
VRRLFVPLLATALLACADPEAGPDRILLNARIWTGDPARPTASAIAISGDRIVAVGSDDSVRALAARGTRIEDLGGRQLLPGFHDAHWHLPTRRQADLVGAADAADIVRRLREFAAGLPADAWVLGRGWTPDMFPGNQAHRVALDGAFPDRPVLITDRDGHQALANSRALEVAGVGPGTFDPAGGAVVKNAAGVPTGLLKETAMGLVRRLLPEPSEAEVHASLAHEMRSAAALGLTALQVANALDDAGTAALERAVAADALLVRLRVAVPFSGDASDADLARYAALRDRHRGPLLRYGIAKGMLDGTVDAGTAAMLAPFAGVGGTGLPRWTDRDLVAALARYDAAGLQVELHAIGDRAIRMALDAFGAVAERNGPRDRRGRVEHVEVPDPADLPRFAALGVIASSQAIFATPDATALTNYAPLLGPERAARAMPFAALDAAGAIQAFGSDYPVFPMDPLLGVYTAVTRQLPDGSPPGGWHPEHRISIEAAIRHYTWGSAYAAFREDELGVLRPGMLADLVVLSEPVIGEPPAALLRARPVLTIMGGRDTFRAEGFRDSPASGGGAVERE